jgi:hypothetical protein
MNREDVFNLLSRSVRGRKGSTPKELFEQYSDEHHSVSSFASKYNMSEQHVVDVTNHAFMHNLPMSVKRKDGREKYRIADFVAVMQEMRSKAD